MASVDKTASVLLQGLKIEPEFEKSACFGIALKHIEAIFSVNLDFGDLESSKGESRYILYSRPSRVIHESSEALSSSDLCALNEIRMVRIIKNAPSSAEVLGEYSVEERVAIYDAASDRVELQTIISNFVAIVKSEYFSANSTGMTEANYYAQIRAGYEKAPTTECRCQCKTEVITDTICSNGTVVQRKHEVLKPVCYESEYAEFLSAPDCEIKTVFNDNFLKKRRFCGKTFACTLTRNDECGTANLEVYNYDSDSSYTGSVALPAPDYLFELPAVSHLVALNPDSYFSGLFPGVQVLTCLPKKLIKGKPKS